MPGEGNRSTVRTRKPIRAGPRWMVFIWDFMLCESVAIRMHLFPRLADRMLNSGRWLTPLNSPPRPSASCQEQGSTKGASESGRPRRQGPLHVRRQSPVYSPALADRSPRIFGPHGQHSAVDRRRPLSAVRDQPHYGRRPGTTCPTSRSPWSCWASAWRSFQRRVHCRLRQIPDETDLHLPYPRECVGRLVHGSVRHHRRHGNDP